MVPSVVLDEPAFPGFAALVDTTAGPAGMRRNGMAPAGVDDARLSPRRRAGPDSRAAAQSQSRPRQMRLVHPYVERNERQTLHREAASC